MNEHACRWRYRWRACGIDRLLTVSICPRRPRLRERTLRPCHWPHWNLTTPRISAGRPPLLRRLTFLPPKRARAWAVGFRTGRKYHYCPLPVIARCTSVHQRAWHCWTHGRRTVERALYDSVFKIRESPQKNSPQLKGPGKGIFKVTQKIFLLFSLRSAKNPRQTAV